MLSGETPRRGACEEQVDEGWEWRAETPPVREHKAVVPAARLLTALVTVLAVGWCAWPAGAARRVEDVLVPSSDTSLLGWTGPSKATAAPARSLAVMAQKEGGDAVVPPVKRQQPKMPEAREPAAATSPAASPSAAPAPATAPSAQTEPQTQPASPSAKSTPAATAAEETSGSGWPSFSGFFAPLTEWLAEANREYQGTIVKKLSQPTPEQVEAERLAQEEAERARQEAARAAAAAEAEKRAAEKRAAEAEAARKAAAAKEAEAKKQAEARQAAEKAEKAKAETAKAEAAKAEAAAKLEAAKQQAAAKKAAEADNEAKRREIERLTADTKAQDAAQQAQARKEQADAERRAREAKLAEERAARAATPPVEPEAAQRHRRWSVTIIPEPIPRPDARSDVRDVQTAQGRGVLVGTGRMSLGAGGLRGPAVKRWIWREGTCRFAGRKSGKPVRYTVARGDSLWRISEKYYEDGTRYPRIYKANRDQISNPARIYPCQKFRVPRR